MTEGIGNGCIRGWLCKWGVLNRGNGSDGMMRYMGWVGAFGNWLLV